MWPSGTCWSTSRTRSAELQMAFSLICLYSVFCIVHVSAQPSPNESISPEYCASSSMNTATQEGLLNGTLSSCYDQIMVTIRALSVKSAVAKRAGSGVVLIAIIAGGVIGLTVIAAVIVYCYYQRTYLAIREKADVEKFARRRVRDETMLSFADAKGSSTSTSIQEAQNVPHSKSGQKERSTSSNRETGKESDSRGNSNPPSQSKVCESSRWTNFSWTFSGFLKMGNSENSGVPFSTFDIMDPSTRASIALRATDLKKATRNFGRKIGEGGFGPVYFGKLPGNQMEVAVKVQAKDSRQGAREFATEVEILSRCKHPNLVSLVGYSEDEGAYMLVYEFLSGGTLQDRLYGKRSCPPLDWNTRLKIAIQAAKGLQCLHNKCVPSIIHRDVKSNNILLTKLDDAKVTDFGLSKFLKGNTNHISKCSVKGTAGYLDPEYYETQNLTHKSDVYSFGIVLLELISGLEPLDTNRHRTHWKITDWARKLLIEGNVEKVADKTLNGKYESESMWTVAELAMACVEHRSEHRPTISQVVQELEKAVKAESKD